MRKFNFFLYAWDCAVASWRMREKGLVNDEFYRIAVENLRGTEPGEFIDSPDMLAHGIA